MLADVENRPVFLIALVTEFPNKIGKQPVGLAIAIRLIYTAVLQPSGG
jgi:hypothetical protein